MKSNDQKKLIGSCSFLVEFPEDDIFRTEIKLRIYQGGMYWRDHASGPDSSHTASVSPQLNCAGTELTVWVEAISSN
jgi:hypothetical protein